MRARPGRERGVALVLVIWLVTLLTVIAGGFAYSVRTDARAARNASMIARGEALALAAVSRVALELFKQPTSPEVWTRQEAPRRWSFDGAEVTIWFTDESAKIDINSANDELLKGLFKSVGLADEEALRLLDAVIDWRDADSLQRPYGAEAPEYTRAGREGQPANYPFQATEELQLVLGMRPDVYQRLAPFITVHSRQPGVNALLAPRQALRAIPNLTPEQVDAFVAERDKAREERRVPPVLSGAGAYVTYGQSGAVTVRAVVDVDGEVRVGREAVVLITPQYSRRPFTLLAWRDLPPGREAAPNEVSVGKPH